MNKLIVSVVLAFLTFSCAGQQVRDSVPEGIPKGYVKFYYLKSEGTNPSHISVYSTDNMDASPYDRNIYGVLKGWDGEWAVGNDLHLTGDEIGVLVAKKPGNYKFMVDILGAPKPQVFNIFVQEGILVPVKLIFSDIERKTKVTGGSRITTSTTTTFRVNIVIEKPVPFVPKK